MRVSHRWRRIVASDNAALIRHPSQAPEGVGDQADCVAGRWAFLESLLCISDAQRNVVEQFAKDLQALSFAASVLGHV